MSAWADHEERITIARKSRVRAGAALTSTLLGEVPVGTRFACYGSETLADGVERVAVGPAHGDGPAKWGRRGWLSAKQLRPPRSRVRVGLCFLVYDAPKHQDLWRAFLRDVDPNRFRVFVHSKTPKTARVDLPSAAILDDPVETEWASIALVHATFRLFGAARDAGCDVFLLLSDTMLPLISFDAVVARLARSTFQIQTTPSKKELGDRTGSYDNFIRPKLPATAKLARGDVLKGNMFFALYRDDFEAIEAAPHVAAFDKIWGGAPDEYYWINAMTIHGRPYAAPGTFLFCSRDIGGATAAETWTLDGPLLRETVGFAFLRKVETVALDARPAYLARIS